MAISERKWPEKLIIEKTLKHQKCKKQNKKLRNKTKLPKSSRSSRGSACARTHPSAPSSSSPMLGLCSRLRWNPESALSSMVTCPSSSRSATKRKR